MKNAEVDYVDAVSGALLATVAFYDPGLDEGSWYSREQRQRGCLREPHLAYGCGRPIDSGRR